MNKEDIIKEGTLKKYTNMVKGYQKRYFRLCKEMLLYYTSKEKIDSESPKKIHLKWASIIPNRNDTITINTGTHTFKLKFASISEKVEWTNALRVTQARWEVVNDTLTSHLADDLLPNLLAENNGNSGSSDETADIKIKNKRVRFLLDIIIFNAQVLDFNLELKIKFIFWCLKLEVSQYDLVCLRW